MLGFIAVLAAAAQEPVKLSEDPDLRCMAAFSVVVDNASKDSSISQDEKAGLMAIVMYYVGRIDVRFPAIDYARELSALARTPGYAEHRFRADLERCGREAEARGRALQEIGKAMEQQVPLVGASPG